MTDRPIIFSGPMIRALLDGRKTQTRRVLRPQPKEPCSHVERFEGPGGGWIAGDNTGRIFRMPFEIGDRLWARETWLDADGDGTRELIYRADNQGYNGPWTPSIHMPRWASRITLTVTDVRVQRVQEISEEDARAEGLHAYRARYIPASERWEDHTFSASDEFRAQWNSLNAKRGHGWDANPWVGVYTFTVQQENIDALPNSAA